MTINAEQHIQILHSPFQNIFQQIRFVILTLQWVKMLNIHWSSYSLINLSKQNVFKSPSQINICEYL